MSSDYETWKQTAKCETCGEQGIVGVAAMPGVPASFAYCRACLDANAHPYAMVVANTAMIYPDQAAEWWVAVIAGTLGRLGIAETEFGADVAAAIAIMGLPPEN